SRWMFTGTKRKISPGSRGNPALLHCEAPVFFGIPEYHPVRPVNGRLKIAPQESSAGFRPGAVVSDDLFQRGATGKAADMLLERASAAAEASSGLKVIWARCF